MIHRAETDADLLRSLEVYNAVHPDDPSSLTEARETERQSRAFAAFFAELDGEAAGGAHVRLPTYSDTSEGGVYVLAAHRRHGLGQRLLDEITAWAAAHHSPTISCWVADDDADSRAWADRRGFTERSRQAFVELDLRAFEPRPVEPPPGVEITTLAERPELTRGLYDVACEALPDIPDSEARTRRSSRSTSGCPSTCRASATGPTGRSSRSPATTSSAGRSSASGTRSPTHRSTTSPA